MRIGAGHWISERDFFWQRVDPREDLFELRASAGPLARLAVGGLVITSADLVTRNHRIIFATEGISGQRIRIVDAGTDQVIASFGRRWSGRTGTLQFLDGARLEWRRTGWSRPTYLFTDRFGNRLLQFSEDGNVTCYGLGAQLDPLIGSWRELAVVLALGWFLLVLAGDAGPAQPAAS